MAFIKASLSASWTIFQLLELHFQGVWDYRRNCAPNLQSLKSLHSLDAGVAEFIVALVLAFLETLGVGDWG
jgi:hypothetical protein